MICMLIVQLFLVFKVCKAASTGQVFMNTYNGRCLAPHGLSAHPAEGTVVVHIANCRDQSVFFRILDSGAIQHVSSGLCIHLSGNKEYPGVLETAILKPDCSDSKYFFTFTSKNSIEIKNKCLRPGSIRYPEGTSLISFGCYDYKYCAYNITNVNVDVNATKDLSGEAFMNTYSGRCLAPRGLSAHPAEGTVVIHTSNCKDQSVFFRILDSGAIQHETSGLCIHLSGNKEYPSDLEKAILMPDCSDSKYFFTFTSKNSIELKNKCLRPISISDPEGTDLISFECEDYRYCAYNTINLNVRKGQGPFMNTYSGRCLAPKGLSAHPAEGTVLIHTSNCRDQSVFFRILDSGAIQHVTSGLCIHLSGNKEFPSDRELAILMSDCSDSKYFFTYTNKNAIVLRNKCLRPNSIRYPEGTDLISFKCEDYLHCTYNIINVIMGCDLNCLGNIIKAKETTNSFDAFFAKSEAEAKSFYSVSSTFFSILKSETPELYKDLLSTHFPIDPKVIQNLEILIQHFGMEKVKSYPSLFLSAAFIRRHRGVNETKPAMCGGTGNKVGGVPAIDEEDADYKLSLSPNELSSLLDNENYEAQAVIDKERQADEEAGINTSEFKVSMIQKLIDHWESKYYYKFWTNESLGIVMEDCEVTHPSEIKFPSRGPGMTTIEYLEYYFSRNTSLLPQKNLKFPWPLSIALNIETSLRQCNWIWRRLENGEKIVRYSRYSYDYSTKAFRCKESDWNPCTVPRYIEDGGVCGRQSTLARVTNHCLGIASGGIKQPGHAAGYNYIKPETEYKFQLFQSIKSMLHTYTVWYLTDDAIQREPKLNAEYHQGLTNAMNHGYESYRNGRIALLLFSRIYNITIRHQSRELLVEALENNPHMMDVWMKLIHDVTGSNDLPIESQNIFERLPEKCPGDFNDSHRSRLLVLVKNHLNAYMQMYLDVLLRLISPPSCCSVEEPKYLETLTNAMNEEKRVVIKPYLFDAYLLCAGQSSSIPEFLDIVQQNILSEINGGSMPEIDPFSEILQAIRSLLDSREESEIEEHKGELIQFYSEVCDYFVRIQITSSAWVIFPQYRVCKEAQLNFLNTYASAEYEQTFQAWTSLQDPSKDVGIWNDYYAKGWLYGRSGDVVPLLVGVKTSVDGAMIHEYKVSVAKNKSTMMSSTLNEDTSSKRAVDGLSDNNIAGGSCASTTTQNNPWYTIDLGQPTQVNGLLISNAEGKAGKHLQGFEIHVGDSLEQNGVTNQKCGNLYGILPDDTRAFYCDPPLIGQYVTINIPQDGKILTICEIAVYDIQLASYRSHGVNLDIWHNIGSKNIQKLYDDSRYPNHPDEKRILSTFEYNEVGSNYGSRLSALYQPLETGNFTFYAACTDQCEVFLRKVDSGEELQRIISLLTATKKNDWTKYDAQKSQPIFLDKEKYYELVATVKEASGRDYITLASKLPSGAFIAPIPPERLFIEMKEESSTTV